MGIRPIGDKSSGELKRKKSGDSVDSGKFKDLLSGSEKSPGHKKIQGLFEGIESAADVLIESKDDSALKEYRMRVKEFLSEVLSESRKIKVITSDSVYEDALVIVEVVDKKLDDLAAIVIKEEVERGEMMKLIDEIKGIIVDLYR